MTNSKIWGIYRYRPYKKGANDLINLKAIRMSQKMTQVEVASQVGIAQSSYSNIEKGKWRPSVSSAKRIAAVLGFDWTRFYEEDGAGEAHYHVS